MTHCGNCIHFPICNIREDYRQLLIVVEPLKKKNSAFEVTANCKFFQINYGKTTRGTEVMNSL